MANIKEIYAQRHYESALDFFEQGNYEKALQQINSAIQKSPNNPDYLATKGVFLHRMNDIPKAIEAYKKALEVFPGHPFSHYNLGIIFIKENKPLQAIQQWEEALKTNPKDIDSIFNIAVTLTKMGKTEQAIPLFQKVLDLNPNHVMSHQNLGVIYRDRNDFSKAKYYFNTLKDLDSTYSEVVDKEIFKCEEKEFIERIDTQKTETQNSISLIDKSGCEEKALSALILDNFNEALGYANVILSDEPESKNALMIKAQALAGLKEFEEAMQVYNRIIEIYPKEIEVFYLMGLLMLDQGNYNQAKNYFIEVKKIDPNYPLVDENIESIEIFKNSNLNGGNND